MEDLAALLQEFKDLKRSNSQTLSSQEHFRAELLRHGKQYEELEKLLHQATSHLSATVHKIPSSVVVKKEYGIERVTWFYLGIYFLSIALALWFSPLIGQELRELELESDLKSMQEHLNYHIENNPKTERRWQERTN